MPEGYFTPMLPQKALGLGPTTFFASRERCRLPESLLLVDAMRRLRGMPCSVSLRAGGRFILSSATSAAGNLTEEEVVEIADYDPVRHSVLAIGSKEPSPDVAIHWLAYRTDPTVAAVAFVWVFERIKGVEYVAGRHPWGSFPEAMALLTLAKSSKGPAGIEGRGYLVRGRTVEELVDAVAKILKLNEKKAQRAKGKKESAQGKGQSARGKAQGSGRPRRPSLSKREEGGRRESQGGN
jgi:hypothetical protein